MGAAGRDGHLASILLIVAAIVVASQGVGSGSGESELLRNVDAHRGAQMISSILQAIGVGLLAAPLYYLFRAAKARSETMRGQLVGVVVAAPLFLARRWRSSAASRPCTPPRTSSPTKCRG